MRLHRFYTTSIIDPKSEIIIHSAELVNQIRNVFRLINGDSVILFDGSGNDYKCVIDNFGEKSTIVSNNEIHLHVDTTSRSAFFPVREITLNAGIVKKDNFEWIVEKATELGVVRIVPILTDRSEKKNLNEERLIKITIEASEQSGRGNIPVINPITSFSDAVDLVSTKKLNAVAFHTEGEILSRSHLDKNMPLQIFIGPEGGWTPKEIDLFHKHNIPLICLGKQTLRSETAVVAALSIVMLGN